MIRLISILIAFIVLTSFQFDGDVNSSISKNQKIEKTNYFLALTKSAENNVSINVVKLFVKENNIYAVYSNSKTKQLTYNNSDRDPLLLDSNNVIFIREKSSQYGSDRTLISIMSVNIATLKERVITNEMPFVDGLSNTNELLMVDNLCLSLDKKYIYFLTGKYVTSAQLVKVNIATGKWQELFATNEYKFITSGSYKGSFLISVSEIRDNGREAFYKILNENGDVIKEFDNYETAIKFLNDIK